MQCRGAKSLVDDLGLSQGVVLSRAAFSLRSIETKPFDWGICPLWMDMSLCHHSLCYREIALSVALVYSQDFEIFALLLLQGNCTFGGSRLFPCVTGKLHF
jgi:hypothetical protein